MPTVFMFAAVALSPTPIPTLSPEQELDAAQTSLGSGRFQEALSILTALRQHDPGNAVVGDRLFRAHVAYGAALLQANDSTGSEAQYTAALQLKPGDPDALNGQRQALLARDWEKMNAAWGTDDATALGLAEEIYRVAPGYRQVRDKLYALLISRADDLLRADDRDGALPVLLEALNLSPDSGAAQVRLAENMPAPTEVPTAQAPARRIDLIRPTAGLANLRPRPPYHRASSRSRRGCRTAVRLPR